MVRCKFLFKSAEFYELQCKYSNFFICIYTIAYAINENKGPSIIHQITEMITAFFVFRN